MSRSARTLDAAVALVVTAVELALLLNDGTASAVSVVATVAAGAAIALRRVAPLPVLGVTLAAAIAIVVAGESPTGVTVLVALATVADACPRRTAIAALVPTTAVLVVLSAVTADRNGRPAAVIVGALATAPLTAGVWAAGAYARTRRRYREELEARAALLEREREQLARIAVHEERAAIARELHDVVAHGVGMMLLGVRGAREVLHRSPELADETLARVEAGGERSVAELRRVFALLRDPPHAPDAHPQPALADLPTLVDEHRAAGLPVRLEVAGAAPELPAGIELSAYRIVQEALTNVRRHAGPGAGATVSVAFEPDTLGLEVVDDGRPVARSDGEGDGHGLVGMRERVALLGGRLEAGPRPGGGFRVAVRLPRDGAA